MFLTCHEDGTSELDDAPLLERATELGRVLFSQDADLLVVAKEWQGSGREFTGLYGHQLQLTSDRPFVTFYLSHANPGGNSG